MNEVNILGFLCEAIGYNHKIYKDLDKAYQKRKYEFYKLAKEHELYNHQLITEGSLLQEEYCKKALGILLYYNQIKDEEIQQDINYILEKGWKYVIQYVRNNSKINLDDFIYKFNKKNKGKITDDDLNTNLLILISNAQVQDKEVIENETFKVFFQVLIERLNSYKYRFSLSDITKEHKQEIKETKDKIFKQLGDVKDYDKLLYYVCGTPLGEIFAWIFNLENLTASLLQTIKWEQDDTDEIIHIYNQLADKTIDPSQYYLSAMYIRYLIKAYKINKQHYFDNNKEIMFAEIDEISKKMNKVESENELLKNENKRIIEVLETTEKKNHTLLNELKTERLKNSELNSLREFMFGLDSQIEYKNDDKIDYEKLKKSKGIIIGGHEKWQIKMKEYLSNYIFIHTDMINFDLGLIDGVDIVFIYVNYLSHSLYYKVMDYIKGEDKKIVYLNQQNDEIVLKEILKNL